MADERNEQKTTTVVMGRDLAGMVRTIAAHREITMADAWEKYGRTAITREYKKVLEEMQAVVTGGEG